MQVNEVLFEELKYFSSEAKIKVMCKIQKKTKFNEHSYVYFWNLVFYSHLIFSRELIFYFQNLPLVQKVQAKFWLQKVASQEKVQLKNLTKSVQVYSSFDEHERHLSHLFQHETLQYSSHSAL